MKQRRARTRPYRMGARAEAAAQTHQRLVDAAIALLSDRSYDEVSLDEVAAAVGVTVQTVLRRFGSKEGLADAASEQGRAQVRAHRWAAAPGDVEAALRDLVAHYEAWGERALRFLAQEERTPPMRKVAEAGRAMHHEWVDHMFGSTLAATRGAARVRLRARLIACTDVYTWKIMRRDLGLDVRATELALRELVTAVLA